MISEKIPNFLNEARKKLWRPAAVGMLSLSPTIVKENDQVNEYDFKAFASPVVYEMHFNEAVYLRETDVTEVEGPHLPDQGMLLQQVNSAFREAMELKVLEKHQSEGVQAASNQQVLSPKPKAISELIQPTGYSRGASMKFITGYYCQYDNGYHGDGGGFCGNMANGEVVHDGAAACGPSYPLGTVFYIEGYGNVVCKDRGSAVNDGKIDVFTYYSSGLSSIPQGQKEVIQGGK